MTTRKQRPAVFFDRDGVINRFPGPGRFVLRWEEFRLLPGTATALARLRSAGFFLAVVTNQSGIGRGLMTEETLREIHRRMQQALEPQSFDAIYYCRHHPDAGCACRKPAPGMLFRAAREHDLDLPRSFLVGDSPRDIETGRAAGCRTVLCRDELPASPASFAEKERPEFMVQTIAEAAAVIMSQSNRATSRI